MCRSLSDSPNPSLGFSLQISTHFHDGFDNVVARVTKRLHTNTQTTNTQGRSMRNQCSASSHSYVHTHTHVCVRVSAVVPPTAYGVYVANGVYVTHTHFSTPLPIAHLCPGYLSTYLSLQVLSCSRNMSLCVCVCVCVCVYPSAPATCYRQETHSARDRQRERERQRQRQSETQNKAREGEGVCVCVSERERLRYLKRQIEGQPCSLGHTPGVCVGLAVTLRHNLIVYCVHTLCVVQYWYYTIRFYID